MIRHFLALFLALTAVRPTAGAVDYPDPTGSSFARTFPYSMVGQLFYRSGRHDYSGSGTVVGARSVLTAGHNVWDYYGGWSRDVDFLRAYYNGTYASAQYATRLYVFGGYREAVTQYRADSARAFARDLGGLRFRNDIADGAYAGWSTDRTLLTGDHYNIGLGYGGEHPHDGEELLFVEPERAFTKVLGAFYENTSIYIEQGMSGGPLFAEASDGKLYISAVIVSGAIAPREAGGVRALNGAAATFLRTYLR
jgi:V8-like Glu-specific endopeptidase